MKEIFPIQVTMIDVSVFANAKQVTGDVGLEIIFFMIYFVISKN